MEGASAPVSPSMMPSEEQHSKADEHYDRHSHSAEEEPVGAGRRRRCTGTVEWHPIRYGALHEHV